MGIADDAKETARATATHLGRAVDDTVDKVKDKVAEIKADVNVKQAEAERDSVHARNAAKEELRKE